MKTIIVKQLMVPVEAYATVSLEATLPEAVLALEKAQMSLDPSLHKHRAILVLDDQGRVAGKIVMKSLLVALEPNYGKVEVKGILERSGYSRAMIKSMLEDNALWSKPLKLVCERAATLKVRDFIEAPAEDEYIDEDATLGEAINQLIVSPYHSLLVTCGDEVAGILRLSDVFTKVCDEIKACAKGS